MTEQSALSVFYDNWHNYQTLLVTAIAPLTPEQLALQAAPHLRSVGSTATHIIGARGRWFHSLMGEGDEEFAAMGQWDRAEMPVRSAAELVAGLEQTWALMHAAMERWTPADLAYVYEGERGGEQYSLSRQWVVWHLIEHDLHHGGEIAITLGMHGLVAPDL